MRYWATKKRKNSWKQRKSSSWHDTHPRSSFSWPWKEWFFSSISTPVRYWCMRSMWQLQAGWIRLPTTAWEVLKCGAIGCTCLQGEHTRAFIPSGARAQLPLSVSGSEWVSSPAVGLQEFKVRMKRLKGVSIYKCFHNLLTMLNINHFYGFRMIDLEASLKISIYHKSCLWPENLG